MMRTINDLSGSTKLFDISKTVQEAISHFNQYHQTVNLQTFSQILPRVEGNGDAYRHVLITLMKQIAKYSEDAQLDVKFYARKTSYQRLKTEFEVYLACAIDEKKLPDYIQTFHPASDLLDENFNHCLHFLKQVLLQIGGSLNVRSINGQTCFRVLKLFNYRDEKIKTSKLLVHEMLRSAPIKLETNYLKSHTTPETSSTAMSIGFLEQTRTVSFNPDQVEQNSIHSTSTQQQQLEENKKMMNMIDNMNKEAFEREQDQLKRSMQIKNHQKLEQKKRQTEQIKINSLRKSNLNNAYYTEIFFKRKLNKVKNDFLFKQKNRSTSK